MLYVESRQNPKVKQALSLFERKHRLQSGLFVFEGYKLAQEALRSGIRVERVFACREELLETLPEDTEGILVPRELLTAMSGGVGGYDALSVARIPAQRALPSSPGLLVLAEGLQDPGNLGALLRTAEAMGLDGVVLAGCADLWNSKTVRASMGSVFRIPCEQTSDLPARIRSLREQGVTVYAAAMHEPRDLILGKDPLAFPCAVVIGSEGRGLTAQTLEACDVCLRIPMAPPTESLNAAAAAAMLMWEMSRRKGELET
ncbi:MAG: RNA methyltransferase [Clostridia bacterium]|nr:RNA methyltransferase [Clostridia bacterium]